MCWKGYYRDYSSVYIRFTSALHGGQNSKCPLIKYIEKLEEMAPRIWGNWGIVSVVTLSAHNV